MHVAQAVPWVSGSSQGSITGSFLTGPLVTCEVQQVQLAGHPPARHSLLILAPVPGPALPEEARGLRAG